MQRYLCYIDRMFHDEPNVPHKVVVGLEAIDGELSQILVLEIRGIWLPLHVDLFTETIFLPKLIVCRHYAPMIP